MKNNTQIATLGGGCFWCTEAVFQEIKGVEHIVSGYSGGQVPGHPTYREVCSGKTGCAETIQITFNTDSISYKEILTVFMTTHDPTAPSNHGADKGSQYRSVIYYHSLDQKDVATAVIKELAPLFNKEIVTELSQATTFYAAEQEHQNYYRDNPEEAYCQFAIAPKLKKLRSVHTHLLKTQQSSQ